MAARGRNMRNMPNGDVNNGRRRRNGGSRGREMLGLAHNLTALVIDNDFTCRAVHRRLLQLLGVDAQMVDSGRVAVEICGSGLIFDLIVVEMRMPDMNGVETTRALRAMGVRSKILGLSAGLEERIEQAFRAAGADGYYDKPLTSEQLVPILRELDNR